MKADISTKKAKAAHQHGKDEINAALNDFFHIIIIHDEAASNFLNY